MNDHSPFASSTARRRRRPTSSLISMTAAVAVTAYATYRLVHWAWNSGKTENEDDLLTEEANRRDSSNSRLDSANNRATPTLRQSDTGTKGILNPPSSAAMEEDLISALKACAPLLTKAVNSSTDFSSAVKSLQQNRTKRQPETTEFDKQQESLLWETIKRKSITRLLLTIYAQILIILIMYIQILLMRRRGITHESSNTRKEVFTETLNYFFSKSLPELSSALETAVQSRLCFWNVTTIMSMSQSEFEAGLDAVRWNFDAETKDTISSFVVKQQIDTLDADACDVLEETWDILESPLFGNAWKEVISNTTAFGVALKFTLDTVFVSKKGEDAVQTTTMPLAKIVTGLKKSSTFLYYLDYKGEEEAWETQKSISQFLLLPSVNALANSCLTI